MKEYYKLIRDKIPEIIEKSGKTPSIHLASEEEYWKMLKEKLSEEVEEFKVAENEEELADILEVIDAILDYKKFSKEAIIELKNKKNQDKGSFKEKIILEKVD
jgi:predicted house-cleaning noncanonical NTP pyrophosphatase (MazG superfamily)